MPTPLIFGSVTRRLLLDMLELRAAATADGHFTVMRFTTNWRVSLDTPRSREDIQEMFEGQTFEEAAIKALCSSHQII